jgi:glycosyltransferase involved in cell wall biosynthesis
MDREIELTPILFTRTDTKEKSFFNFLRDLHVPHETIYVNTSRVKYLNPLRNIVEAINCFRRKQFDLIHTHGYRADLIGFIVSKYFGLPIVSTCHGYISNDRHLNFYNGLDVFLLRYFDRVIAVSEQMKKDLVGKRIDKGNIHVITNAVWGAAVADKDGIRSNIRSRLGIGNKEFVFGFVGRLSEEKGLSYLVEAVETPADGRRGGGGLSFSGRGPSGIS